MSDPPAPLTLTLEAALRELAVEGYALIPPFDGTDRWGWSVAGDAIETFDGWAQAATAALGRQVIARDEAAELRAEENARLRDAIDDLLTTGGPNVGTPEVEAAWKAACDHASELLGTRAESEVNA